jgi:TATA-binding protein-associated factor
MKAISFEIPKQVGLFGPSLSALSAGLHPHLFYWLEIATAKAARRIRADHSLILSGTPVQNKVQEIFAAFDFLMPNFLGSPASFASEFANPIAKSHLPGATAEQINQGIEKLKMLHQQVLPFILRREKEEVLKELPPKTVSTIPCEMSNLQRETYEKFLATEEAKLSIKELQRVLQEAASTSSQASTDDGLNIGSDALKTTHPVLVEGSREDCSDTYTMDMSGKFVALAELLRACGIHQDQISGADNDTSVLYCNADEDDENENNDLDHLLNPVEYDCVDSRQTSSSTSKALVFAHFTQSLDALEELLVKRHMPSVNYLRLDGRVPPTKRSALVDAFNNDPSIKLMLLTTRVGSLGLNLTGADTVIFLENDFNPFVDMQAADRAHRIGQSKTVNVYRLVTKNTIEEKIMSIQERKIALSKAIVNTDNSTLFSMGTDRLLDIFTCRTESQNDGGSTNAEHFGDGGKGYNLDALVDNYKDEYSALSVQGFLQALKK